MFSALGLLFSNLEMNETAPFLHLAADAPFDEAERRYAALAERIAAVVGGPREEIRFSRQADVRFAGQAYELTVPFGEAWDEGAGEDQGEDRRNGREPNPGDGRLGGRSGSASWNYVNPGRSDPVLPVLMTEVEKLKCGDVFRHEMSGGGGGGYGEPLDRDPEGVLRNVIEEKVTREHAEREYGVVLVELESDGAWTLDVPATENLREQMRTAAAD